MKAIPLTQGQHALVDDEDYKQLIKWRWRVNTGGYAIRRTNGKEIFMHRFILGINGDMQIDHINRNKLDNRKQNLRFCTPSQNCGNRTKTNAPTTSQYKGVTWHKRCQKWQAQMQGRGKGYLGLFTHEIDAARAYDAAARESFGEFALLNFPESE